MVYKLGERGKSNRDWIILIAIYLTAFSAGFALYAQYLMWSSYNKLENTVDSVCDYTISHNTALRACSIAQNASHAKYKCDTKHLIPSECNAELK